MRKPAILHYGDTLPPATEFEDGDLFYLRPAGELYIRTGGAWALSASSSMITSVQNDGTGVELVSDTGTSNTAKVRSVNTTGNGITIAITASGQEIELNFDKVAAGWGVANGFATLDANTLLKEFPALASIADLQTATGVGSSVVHVRGYYSANDGGGGIFYYDSSDTTSSDNGITVIVDADGKRWKRTVGRITARQCGLVPDDSTKATTNTTALKNALANLSYIYFESGSYYLDNTGGITITGYSGYLDFEPGAKLVLTVPTDIGIKFVNASNAIIRGCAVDFSPVPTTRTSYIAFGFVDSTDITVEDFTSTNSPSSGLFFSECVRPTARNIYISNSLADGLHFANCQDPYAANVKTSNTGDDGLAFVNYSTLAGYTGGMARGVVVNSSSARGIAVVGQSNVVVDGFYVDTTTSFGLYVAYESTYSTRVPDNVVIKNGTVVNAGSGITTSEGVITVINSGTVSIGNVRIDSSPGRGINASGNTALTINGVLVSSATSTGINASSASGYIRITNSSFENTGGAGIYASGKHVVVSGIRLYNTSKTNTLYRALWLENSTDLLVDSVLIVDDQTTATGYIAGFYGTISSGRASNIHFDITSGTPTVQNNAGVAMLGVTPPISISTPAVPASGTPVTNTQPGAVMVSVSGGTVTDIAINGTSTGRTAGSFMVPPGGTITLTYSAVPSWVWTIAA